MGFFARCLAFASDHFSVNVNAIARLKIQACISPDVLGRNRESIVFGRLLLCGGLGIQGGQHCG